MRSAVAYRIKGRGRRMYDLTGKRALVTGSTQGIGKAIAKLLAERGATVIVHGSSSREKCERAAQEMQGNTEMAVESLSESGCAQRLYDQTGDVDILVLNASVQVRKAWDKITEEEFARQMDTNVRASLFFDTKICALYETEKMGKNSDDRKRSAV